MKCVVEQMRTGVYGDSCYVSYDLEMDAKLKIPKQDNTSAVDGVT